MRTGLGNMGAGGTRTWVHFGTRLIKSQNSRNRGATVQSSQYRGRKQGLVGWHMRMQQAGAQRGRQRGRQRGYKGRIKSCTPEGTAGGTNCQTKGSTCQQWQGQSKLLGGPSAGREWKAGRAGRAQELNGSDAWPVVWPVLPSRLNQPVGRDILRRVWLCNICLYGMPGRQAVGSRCAPHVPWGPSTGMQGGAPLPAGS